VASHLRTGVKLVDMSLIWDAISIMFGFNIEVLLSYFTSEFRISDVVCITRYR